LLKTPTLPKGWWLVVERLILVQENLLSFIFVETHIIGIMMSEILWYGYFTFYSVRSFKHPPCSTLTTTQHNLVKVSL